MQWASNSGEMAEERGFHPRVRGPALRCGDRLGSGESFGMLRLLQESGASDSAELPSGVDIGLNLRGPTADKSGQQ